MIERHIARIRARHRLSEAEEAAIRDLVADIRVVPARTVLTRGGERLDQSALLLDGLMCRFKDLPDGERQVTELQVAGDFTDLHGFTLKRLDHTVQTLGPCVIGVVPHRRLLHLFAEHPRLARIYWFSTNLDAAIHREWELSLGRRTAVARVAALICELSVRLGLVGLVGPTGFDLPMTQTDLADCLGLTSVHVNRTLRQLREEGLASFRSRFVTLLDEPGLRRLAAFNDDYLYLDPDDL